jgi:hypothetical protein
MRGVSGALLAALSTYAAWLGCSSFGTASPSGEPDATTTLDASAVEASGDVDVDAANSVRYVFTTSDRFSGEMLAPLGLETADQKCNEAAQRSLKLKTRKFKAWLSTLVSPASTRVTPSSSNRRIVRTDDVQVASAWSTFLLPIHDAEIDHDENGSVLPDLVQAWTATAYDGSFKASSTAGSTACANWTANTSDATWGDPFKRIGWSSAGVAPCSNTLHLYCIED